MIDEQKSHIFLTYVQPKNNRVLIVVGHNLLLSIGLFLIIGRLLDFRSNLFNMLRL